MSFIISNYFPLFNVYRYRWPNGKRKKLFYFALCLTFLAVMDYGQKKEAEEVVRLLPVCVEGRYGYIDKTGKYVWEPSR